MGKKNFTYSLSEEVIKEMEEAAESLYRSKSSIVQEAIQDWIRRHEDK